MSLTSQMSFRVVGLGSLAVEEHVAYITNEFHHKAIIYNSPLLSDHRSF